MRKIGICSLTPISHVLRAAFVCTIFAVRMGHMCSPARKKTLRPKVSRVKSFPQVLECGWGCGQGYYLVWVMAGTCRIFRA